VITPASTSASPVAKALRVLAGAVLLIALGIAPLNYASTRLLPFELLIELVAVGAGIWAISNWAAGGAVRPPATALVGALLVAVSAAVWVLTTRPTWPDFTVHHYAQLVQRWPYSMMPRTFALVATWALVAIAGLFALTDLARNVIWRRSIAATMVVSGALVSLLGLVQNATRAPGIYWDGSQRMPGAFFGTFFHHTSAGAYLNSVWPLGFALALGAIRSGNPSPRNIALIYGSLVCAALILAAHSGHVSRLPQVIAAGAFVVFTLWAGLWRALGQVRGLRTISVSITALLFIVVVGLGATRVGDIRARWELLDWSNLRGGRTALSTPPESEWPQLMRDDLFVPSNHRAYPLGDRGAAYATAARAIAQRPWFGWGPGTGWTAAAAQNSKDPFVRTFFLLIQFTHSDPLQTCIEWGLVGAVGWALLLPGSLVHAIPRLGPRPSRDFIGAGAVTAIIAVLIQSLTDFPLQIPAIQFNIAALAALAWSVPGPGESHPPFTSSTFSHERV
jgi:hypothetical protein